MRPALSGVLQVVCVSIVHFKTKIVLKYAKTELLVITEGVVVVVVKDDRPAALKRHHKCAIQRERSDSLFL